MRLLNKAFQKSWVALKALVGLGERSDKSLTRPFVYAYLLALVLIGALSLVSHIAQDAIVQKNQFIGSKLNVGGRQRMYSQRIAWKAQQLMAVDNWETPAGNALRKELYDSAEAMQLAHQRLLSKEFHWAENSPLAPKLETLYFNGPNALNALCQDYVRLAKNISKSSSKTEAQRYYEELLPLAQQTLLDSFEEAMEMYQKNMELQIKAIRFNSAIALWVLMITLALEALLIFVPVLAKIQQQEDKLNELAQTDPLTGCFNRRSLFNTATQIMRLAKRNNHPVSVIVMDIDFFKKVNDCYGHGTGDEVIKKVAETAQGLIRQSDLIGRMGGEEFAIILSNASEAQAAVVAEKIRTNIEGRTFYFKGASFSITLSMGVAAYTNQSDHNFDDPDSLIQKADTALYVAKNTGRNQVVCLSTLPKDCDEPYNTALEV